MDGPQILTVKDLNRYIKRKLEGDNLLQDVHVKGEISNFTHHSSGHMYFTLKDADSRIKCIMFATHNQRLAFLPRDGNKVMARGNISIYERDGQYQFYITQMQPDGIGNLYLQFEQLKKKLEAEGLFAPHVKKPLPRFPKAIGIITSPTGAAVRDILTTLHRRFPSVSIVLFPVLVQGSQAAASIARAIRIMNERAEVDVLIVGRGGGSLEELWAFNEEIVARSIFASVLPVLSAVGHETDFTISDFVADVRAATPTAAAELAVPHYLELTQQLDYFSRGLQRGLMKKLETSREKLDRLRRSPSLANPRKQLIQPAERLDRLREQLGYKIRNASGLARNRVTKLEHQLLAHNPKERIRFAGTRAEAARKRLVQTMNHAVRLGKSDLQAHLRQLDALSPLKVMQRGYSLVYDEKEKKVLNSVSQVQLGDILKIRLTDGRIDCHVWSMEDKAE